VAKKIKVIDEKLWLPNDDDEENYEVYPDEEINKAEV